MSVEDMEPLKSSRCTSDGVMDTPPPKPARCSIQDKEDETPPSPSTLSTNDDEHLTEEEENWAFSINREWPSPDSGADDEDEDKDHAVRRHHPVPKPKILKLEKKLKNCINRVIKLEERLPLGDDDIKENESDVVVNIKLNVSQSKCYIQGDKTCYGYVVGRGGQICIVSQFRQMTM